MMPWNTSAAAGAMLYSDWMVSLPLVRMQNSTVTTIMARGFRFASQATVMAVKPTLFATDSVSVLSAPEAWSMPARPARPAERNIVRTTIFFTFMPA